ncbi:MAG: hypothetical protein H7Y38_12090 [Armatimonadetes bacterium]|nr:hypothetical protein [Armatimonadota bacterium]
MLIDRLWEDAALEDGRRSLRVALAALRRVLEPTGTPTGTILLATRDSVTLCADAVTTGVAAFERAARRGDTETVRQLFAAGELPPTFYDDWVLRERERLTDAHDRLAQSGRVAVAEPSPAITLPPAPRDPRERLPVYLTRYIGRETERETLAALLMDATNRLITVTGTGEWAKRALSRSRWKKCAVQKRCVSSHCPMPPKPPGCRGASGSRWEWNRRTPLRARRRLRASFARRSPAELPRRA